MLFLPPADLLAWAGMGIVGLFGLWKARIEPTLRARGLLASPANV